ncbi:MAG: glycosyltransferase [Acidobacteriaceae bacterium]|nr:glycosyltransferase [Acidobacteriaceae bacterium]
MELSIVLPARNEEQTLAACLASLAAQSEPGFELGREWEIVVVNDDSADRTREIAAEIAASHAGVTLIDAPPLDGQLNGKNNACWAGAQTSRGRWLLFTDADTIHEPGDLRRALSEAEQHQVAMLSYSPRQTVTGFWQRAVMPLIFAELTAVYPPALVSDPKSSVAAANGQFLMVERDAYFAIGGHRAQGTNVLEDVALARAIKHSRPIRFRYAPDALATRMYRSTSAMIEGWTKNLALLMPRPVWLAAWRALEFALFFALPLLVIFEPRFALWLLLPWALLLWHFYARVAKSGFPAIDIAISILGAPLFVSMMIRSAIAHRLRRSVTWKGRSYPAGR